MDFILRPFTINDLDSLVIHANNKNIAINMTNKFPYPYTKEHGKNFIEFAISKNPNHILAIDIKDKAVGSLGIHVQEDIACKNAELGYWISENYWNKGIISSAIQQMVEYGFKNYAIDRIYARPFGYNTASQRVLEKNNFVLEAELKNTVYKNGIYTDELIYAARK
jgi:ribosomal-protein-alanine N-acetyltransferase